MTTVKITDPFFMKAIVDLSANDMLFFTPKQFLYFLDRRSKRKAFSWVKTIGVYMFFSVWVTGFVGGILSISIGQNIAFPLALLLWNILCIFWLFSNSDSSQSSYRTRKSSAIALQLLSLIILIGGLYLSVQAKFSVGYVLVPLMGMTAIVLGTIQRRRAAQIADSFSISPAQTIEWLNTWSRVNGEVTKMLAQPETLAPTVISIPQNSDVTEYSFDRLVVCDRDEIAQMLIANNFHFENNCAILSINGYPAALFDTVMQMLRRNPELMVYAFHDASPAGVNLVRELRTSPRWFQESSATIVDLGLLPRQVLSGAGNFFAHRTSSSVTAAMQLAADLRDNLTTAELVWLDAGNYVELESFTPQKLIQILNRGIANSRDLNFSSDDGLIIWSDDVGSGNVYAIESFG